MGESGFFYLMAVVGVVFVGGWFGGFLFVFSLGFLFFC